MINEVSQGETGSREYVELVIAGVTSGCNPACLDLRGWYLDDNNGYFANGSGKGIAAGCLRFAYVPQWECVQIGTIILIYNDLDFDPSLIPANDETDVNGDLVYVIPVGSSLFDGHATQPSTTNQSYPTTGFSPGGTWASIGMANSSDSFQVLDDADLTQPVISLSWGNNNENGNEVIYFAGSAGGTVVSFVNTTDNDYLNQANWVQADAATDQTPGLPNSPENAAWLSSMLTYALPEATIVAPELPCGNGTIQLDATGSTGTITGYAWDGPGIVSGNTTGTPTINAVGDYSVTITDDNGCTDRDTVTVIQGNSLVVDLGPDTTICLGGSITLDPGIPTATYQWSIGATTQSIIVNTSGTYTVDVDSLGCTGSDAIIVTVNPLPFVSLGGNQAICDGESLLLDAGNPGGEYIWSPNSESTQTISALVADTYAVTVTDQNGCTNTDLMSLTVNASPVVDLGADTSFCEGNSLLLDAANAGSTYSWSPGSESSQTITVSTTDLYTVTVTNGSNCTTTDDINITVSTAPQIDLGADQGICDGESTMLDAGNPGSTYLWTPGSLVSQGITVTASGLYSVTVTNPTGCTGTDNINITVNPSPLVELGNDTSFCEGGGVVLNAANAGASYSWMPGGESSQTISVSTSNTYTVTVTNASNCSTTDNISITVNPAPQIDFGADQSLCEGDSLLLDAENAGSTYQWSPNFETSQTITVYSSGIYAVTITSAALCTSSESITVSFNLTPVVDLGADTSFCEDNPVTLDAGSSGVAYTWSNNDTTQTTTPDITDLYIVTVTDGNDCSTIDSIDVTVNSLPEVDLGDTLGICDGDSIMLNAENPGSTYLWSPDNDTTQFIYVSTGGDFSVSVTDTNTCIGIDSVTTILNAMYVSLGSDTAICEGETLTIDAQNSGSTYTWSTAATTQSIEASETDTYSVTVTTASGCIGGDELILTVNSQPTVDLGGNTSFCEGENVTIDAGDSGETYSWSTGDTSQSVIINAGGSYSVTVTSLEGCTSVDGLDVTETEYPVIKLGNDLTMCDGDFIILDAENSGMEYIWNDGQTSRTILTTVSGTYSVTVTNVGCTASDSVVIMVYSLPEITVSENQNINEGESVQISVTGAESYTYQWSPPESLDNATSETPTASPSVTTWYTVVATNSNSCQTVDTVIVFVVPNEIETYNTFTPDNDGTNDTWHIVNIEKFEGHLVQIYNRNGNLVYETGNYESNEWDGTFREAQAPAATYYYIINLGENNGIEKGFITIIR